MKPLFRSVLAPALAGAMFIIAAPPHVIAQCPSWCGDVNGNGTVTSADFFAMLGWIYGGTPPAGSLDCADIDNYAGVTIRDAVRLWCTFENCDIFECPVVWGPFVPDPSTDYSVIYSNVFPAGDSVVTLQIDLVNADYIDGMTLPFLVSVEGAIPTIDSVVTDPDGICDWHTGLSNVSGAPPGHLLLGYFAYHPQVPPGSHHVARARLSLPPAAVERTIQVDWTPLPPDNTPLIVSYVYNGFEPRLFGCPILMTGDANGDGAITAADIIYAVNFAFKGWLAPKPCEAVLDVNCSGAVTSADAIVLVNYIFKGGPPPCNVCVLVGEGTWSCP